MFNLQRCEDFSKVPDLSSCGSPNIQIFSIGPELPFPRNIQPAPTKIRMFQFDFRFVSTDKSWSVCSVSNTYKWQCDGCRCARIFPMLCERHVGAHLWQGVFPVWTELQKRMKKVNMKTCCLCLPLRTARVFAIKSGEFCHFLMFFDVFCTCENAFFGVSQFREPKLITFPCYASIA